MVTHDIRDLPDVTCQLLASDFLPGRQSVNKTIEDIVATEVYGHRLPPADWEFIAALRKAAAAGVGYGAMQQYCEWEWRSKYEGAWGPLSHQEEVDALEPDAERYRWLRDQRRWLFNLPPTPGISICEKLLGWRRIVGGWIKPDGFMYGGCGTPSFTTWAEAGLILDAFAAQWPATKVALRALGGSMVLGGLTPEEVRITVLEYLRVSEQANGDL